jgi:alpha-beta hydrolase superfamily lysophospholipase
MAEYICRLFAPEAQLSPTNGHAAKKPSIVLVPTVCHVPAHYSKLKACLEQAGYRVVLLHNPSVGPFPPPDAFDADVHQVREAVIKELRNERDVVLVAHGYGGKLPLASSRPFA